MRKSETDLTDIEMFRLEFLYEYNVTELGEQYEKAARMMALAQVLLERKPKKKAKQKPA